jgi:hypothetical protein
MVDLVWTAQGLFSKNKLNQNNCHVENFQTSSIPRENVAVGITTALADGKRLKMTLMNASPSFVRVPPPAPPLITNPNHSGPHLGHHHKSHDVLKLWQV